MIFLKEKMDDLKVLAIDKGLGLSKISFLRNLISKDRFFVVEVPEPTEMEDMEKGLEVLKQRIDEIHPNLVIAGSRGGKYAVEMMNRKIYAGSYLLISAMSLTGIPKGER